MSPIERLASVVGAAHARPGEPLRDVAWRAIGTPRAVVAPASAAEVAAIVSICRELRIGLVPVGARTAYWAPLAVDGCVALDVSRLDTIEHGDDATVAGAGALVRTLDVALRARGRCLPIHPDAFGDTPVGSMVATACTSGIGMGQGSIDDALLGVEVVLGTGEVTWTGSRARSALPAFVREGIPDATGLFLGSEGGLGVVTRVAIAPRRAPHRVRLATRVREEALRDVVELGRAWSELYDTFRITLPHEPAPAAAWECEAWVVSPFSADEALARARGCAGELGARARSEVRVVAESEAARLGRSPDHDARFLGPIGGHRELTARAALIGVDVNAPYAALDPLLAAARALVAHQLARGVAHTRIALYLAPTFVNLGVHATAFAGTAHDLDDAAPHLDAIARLPVVPYRLGRAWPAWLGDDLRRSAPLLSAIKRACDPDAILHPGHPLWS